MPSLWPAFYFISSRRDLPPSLLSCELLPPMDLSEQNPIRRRAKQGKRGNILFHTHTHTDSLEKLAARKWLLRSPCSSAAHFIIITATATTTTTMGNAWRRKERRNEGKKRGDNRFRSSRTTQEREVYPVAFSQTEFIRRCHLVKRTFVSGSASRRA